MSTVRLRRLAADFRQLEDYARRHPRLRLIQSDGDPPERYQIEYRVRSLRQVDGELLNIKSHIVEIVLPRSYPRVPPQCRMLTPVFHPNIAPHAICVGDHWSAGESLKSIVVRIGVAGAAVAVYSAMILTRVLTEEERAALQRMVPFGRGGR